MARKRMIDPDFWTDEKLGLCKRDERLFFMGLISNADDEGKGRGNIKLLRSMIFPYDDDIKTKDVEQMACSIMEKGMALFYVIDGQDFYYLPNFNKHQVINKPNESKIPNPPENRQEVVLPEYYSSTTVVLPPNRKEVKLIEEKRKEYIVLRREIILYLNKKTGSNYNPDSKQADKFIKARLEDGFVLDEFMAVIDNKCRDWIGTDQAKYLRPETLFGTKFESYLNQPGKVVNMNDRYDKYEQDVYGR